MVMLRSLFFTTLLFLSCWFSFPSPAAAGGNNKHGGGNSGIDILLTTGVIAKLLQGGGGGGGGGGARSVPIGGRHYESPHGAQSMRVMMPHNHGPPPMHFPPPMMVFPQPMHMNPQQQPMPQQPMTQQTDSQPRIPGYEAQTTHQNTAYGHFSDFQPKDKIEIIRM